MYVNGAGIVIVGYDVTCKKTLGVCAKRIDYVKNCLRDGFVLVAVGNKIDLPRKVSREEAISFFEEHGIPSSHYFETSAKSGEGVEELFVNAVRIWYEANKHHLSDFIEKPEQKLSDDPHPDDIDEEHKKQCIIS